jgi:hypothetical protein
VGKRSISVTRSLSNLGSMMRAGKEPREERDFLARTAIGPMAATYIGGSYGDPDKENG